MSATGCTPPDGWITQLLATVRQTLFHPSWDPVLRLLLIAVVAVALFLVVRAAA